MKPVRSAERECGTAGVKTRIASITGIQRRMTMSSKRKRFRPGVPIRSLDELTRQEFVFFNGKLYHKGWFASWQLMWCATHIRYGELLYAVKEDNEDDK